MPEDQAPRSDAPTDAINQSAPQSLPTEGTGSATPAAAPMHAVSTPGIAVSPPVEQAATIHSESVRAPSAHSRRRWVRFAIWTVGLTTLILGLSLPFSYWRYRFTSSMTNDAFVETRLVNLAPQTSGLVVRVPIE